MGLRCKGGCFEGNFYADPFAKRQLRCRECRQLKRDDPFYCSPDGWIENSETKKSLICVQGTSDKEIAYLLKALNHYALYVEK